MQKQNGSHWLAIGSFFVCFVGLAAIDTSIITRISNEPETPYFLPVISLVLFVVLLYQANRMTPSRKREIIYGAAFAIAAFGVAQLTYTPWWAAWRTISG